MNIAPSEKHLEDWIYANHQDFFSQIPTLWARRIIGRQFELASGRPDLIVAAKLGLRVIELKKGVVDGEAVAQVIRYTGEIRDLFNWADCHVDSPDDPHYYDQTKINPFYPLVKGVLIGHSFTRKALLACATNDITAITYECYDDGYLFEETCELIDTDYFPAMESDLGAAIKEVMRHRRLFIEDIESLKAIYMQEGTL